MKVVEVYGDDDYGVVSFENSEFGGMPAQQLYDFIESHHGIHEVEYNDETDEGGFIMKTHNFEGVTVTDEFLAFLADIKDYDSSKHHDWFVVSKD